MCLRTLIKYLITLALVMPIIITSLGVLGQGESNALWFGDDVDNQAYGILVRAPNEYYAVWSSLFSESITNPVITKFFSNRTIKWSKEIAPSLQNIVQVKFSDVELYGDYAYIILNTVNTSGTYVYLIKVYLPTGSIDWSRMIGKTPGFAAMPTSNYVFVVHSDVANAANEYVWVQKIDVSGGSRTYRKYYVGHYTFPRESTYDGNTSILPGG